MHPLRSFLTFLIFLSILAALSFSLPGKYRIAESRIFFPVSDREKTSRTENHDSLKWKAADTVNPYITEPDSGIKNIDREFIPSSSFSSFLDSLTNSRKQVRILFYGDSQTEADRITARLRSLLRDRRGGSGPGLMLPLMPVMYTRTVLLKSSANWERYNYISFRNGIIGHNRLGPFMTICRFIPEGKKMDKPQKAWIKIRPAPGADPYSSLYDNLRIFYGNAEEDVTVTVRSDGEQKCKAVLKATTLPLEYSCELKGVHNVEIEFEGTSSPDIYGISLESKTGVIVDNISLRGSAGLEFTMTDIAVLGAIYKQLSPDLIVLSYGLNVVKSGTRGYGYYEKGLKRQLHAIAEAAPGVPVLLAGVTDMARQEGGRPESYNNIKSIRDAQARAAAAGGAAFWDAWKAMGGESSVLKWSAARPPLVGNDLTHLSIRGGDSLAVLMFNGVFNTPLNEKTSKGNALDSLPDKQADEAVAADSNVSGKRKTDNSIGARLLPFLSYNPDAPMIFTTAGFWIFFIIILGMYVPLWNRIRLRNGYLLVASLFFYYKSGGFFLILLLLVTAVDYNCGLLISKEGKRKRKLLFLLISIISNIFILAYFKYTGFFIDAINNLTGTGIRVHDYIGELSNSLLGTHFDVSSIILPAGISFFTFQSLSYTIDVYRGRVEPVRNIADFGFYVSFFPQLVAGPIVRASEFIPQLYSSPALSEREFNHAVFQIVRGLIKKIVISDFIASGFIDRVFDAPVSYSGLANLIAVYGYGLQIYCDFSGYTDIAKGLALILGFRLPVNFNSPYKAASPGDFWRRWHISLSRWLKDYIYIPLGGNRKGKFRTGLNLMITMMLGGLWHGADIRFIIWGFLHGAGLMATKLFKKSRPGGLQESRAVNGLMVFLTFQFVSFAWIFFRAHDFDSAMVMIKQIFTDFEPSSVVMILEAYSSVLLVIATGYILHFIPDRMKEDYRGVFIRFPAPVRYSLLMAAAIVIIKMHGTGVTPFIYFRF